MEAYTQALRVGVGGHLYMGGEKDMHVVPTGT